MVRVSSRVKLTLTWPSRRDDDRACSHDAAASTRQSSHPGGYPARASAPFRCASAGQRQVPRMRVLLAADAPAEDEEVERIFIWLRYPDSSSKINNLLLQRARSTGSWFLDGEAFSRFKAGTTRVLWLRGKGSYGVNHESIMLTCASSWIWQEYHDVSAVLPIFEKGSNLHPLAQQQVVISAPSATPPGAPSRSCTSSIRRTTPRSGTCVPYWAPSYASSHITFPTSPSSSRRRGESICEAT